MKKTFGRGNLTELQFQGTLMRNAVWVYTVVKDHPGVEFQENSINWQTALISRNKAY